MGKLVISGRYEHQNGEKHIFEDIIFQNLSNLVKSLKKIGGHFNIQTNFEYYD